MKCLRCLSYKTIKYGKTKKQIQIYKCLNCKRRFREEYSYQSRLVTNQQIITLVKEGCGIRSIGRILNISPTTVISRIKRIANSIQKPAPILLGRSYEIDELCTYIGKKRRRVWVTYALQKETRKVIDLIVGTRSKKTMRKVTDTVLLLRPILVFTDKFRNYKSLIPGSIHITRKRCINHIERMNLNLRTHLKRLNRKTICYSKSMVMLLACLKIYFWA